MGSGSSKTRRIEGNAESCGSSTSSFSSASRRKRNGVLGTACLGSSSRAYDSDEKNDNIGFDDDQVHASDTNIITRADGSSSQAFSGQSVNHSSRFLSRFSFVPGSVSFRLHRAANVGSSRTYPPTSFAASTCEDVHLHGSRPHGSSDNVVSGQDLVDSNNEMTRSDLCLPSSGNFSGLENANKEVGNNRNGAREQDRNVRFSRAPSVGRLHDRVLRRSSFLDLNLSSSPQEGMTTSDENSANSLMSSTYSSPSMPNRYNASQSSDVETSHTGHARQQDVLEHRSTFMKRRRRIRCQVCLTFFQRFGRFSV